MSRPTVHVLATGGTIANPPDVDGYLTGQELVDSVPELANVASVHVHDVTSKASSAIGISDWVAIEETVDEAIAGGANGIVITHGSNSMEETAYLLHLTLDTTVPVALTAAQRNFGTVGNDGNRNLLDAVRAVSHPDAVGRGVFVVVNDQVHSARDVTKSASGRPDAWRSGDFGPIGLIDKDGLVQFYRSPDRAHTLETPFEALTDPAEVPRVEFVYSAVGIGGQAVTAALDQGADGIVLAAYPTGSADRSGGADQATALEVAADEIPVAVSHRGLEGWPRRQILDEGPFIWADTLPPAKARILLALGLQVTTDRDKLQEYFLNH